MITRAIIIIIVITASITCYLVTISTPDQDQDNTAALPKTSRKFEIMAQNRTHVAFQGPENAQWQGAFTFILAADTQLGLQERYVEKKANPGWTKEVEWTREMVAEVNGMSPKPKFLVVCGDLIDAYPTDELKDTRRMQEEDLKHELIGLNIPLVCVCGNHDVGDIPTPATIETYTDSFGDDYFSFYSGGVYFLALNSQFWKDNSMCGALSDAHEAWLDAELQKIKEFRPRHSIVLMHIPPFIAAAGEEDAYFNIDLQTRARLLRKFKDAGIKYVFSGHYHRNAGGSDGEIEVVVTSAVGAQLGSDKNGYRVVKVYEDRIEHYYKALDSTAKGLEG